MNEMRKLMEMVEQAYTDFSGPTYDTILDGHEADTEEDALDYARGMVWSEVETTENSIKYARYIDVVNGVEVYYDYGADYYFFAPAEDEYDQPEYDDMSDHMKQLSRQGR